MNNTISIAAFMVIGFTKLQAQVFKNTSTYSLTEPKHVSYSHNAPDVDKIPVYLLDANKNKLHTFMVSNEHGVSGTEVAVATNTTLLNVKKILKVTLPECACGCEIYTHYFIVTTNDNMIALPEISWTSHEDPEIYWFEYKATSAKRIDLIAYEHDDEAALFKAYKNGTHKSLIPKQKVIKSYTWDGKSLKEI